MKIIVLCRINPFANSGAASNRLLGLLEGISNSDISLLILGGYYGMDEREEYSNGGLRDGIRYFYLSKQMNVNIWQRRVSEYVLKSINIFLLQREVHKLLDKITEKTIVWIENDIYSYRVIKKLHSNPKLKFFMEINEYPDIHLSNNSTKNIIQNRSKSKALKIFYKVLPKLNGIAFMTNTLHNYFEGRISPMTRILHLPMSVDLKRFNLSREYSRIENLECPYICFVGSMNDAKDGVNILIEAFAKISKKFPDFKLALFGFWAYDTFKHRERIKNLGIQDRVIYSKPIGSIDVVKLIMNSEILVLPRPDSYQASGGFPTKLGEYLASARPVIVTCVGEIPNYVNDGESAFLVKPGDVESLVNKLIYVIENRETANYVALNGRRVAEENFCSEKLAQELKEFLELL